MHPAVSLSNYGIGVCLSALALWLYFKWRDETPTGGQWLLFVGAILVWPLAWAYLPIRFLLWLRFRYEMAKDYRSPDRR